MKKFALLAIVCSIFASSANATNFIVRNNSDTAVKVDVITDADSKSITAAPGKGMEIREIKGTKFTHIYVNGFRLNIGTLTIIKEPAEVIKPHNIPIPVLYTLTLASNFGDNTTRWSLTATLKSGETRLK